MKVIDNHTIANDSWHVGDMLCYWNYKNDKKYGLIAGKDIFNDRSYMLVRMGSDLAGFLEVTDCTEIADLQKFMKRRYRCVEKVNAHLVVED